MTLIPYLFNQKPEPIITFALYTNKTILKNRGMPRDNGEIVHFALSQLQATNKRLFDRFVIIHCPPSKLCLLSQDLKDQGWEVFLKAHSHLLATNHLNAQITNQDDLTIHTRNVDKFYDLLQTVRIDYPNSPLIPIVHFHLGIYNQYFLRKVSTETSLIRAYDYYKASSDQNYAAAQYKLGKMVYRGKPYQANAEKGKELFFYAVNQQNAQAQYKMGTLYEQAKLYQHAFDIYQKAAVQNNPKACFALGICFEKGLGTEKSAPHALAAYEKAATLGHAQANYRAGLCYDEGFGCDINKHKAFNFFKVASAKKIAGATCQLAEYAEYGIVDKVDIHKAIQYYEIAAALNSNRACYKLGIAYQLGICKKINLRMSLTYYEKAAQNNYGPAEYSVGEFAEHGYLEPADLQKAIPYYQRSASQNYPQAQFKLGLLYETGALPTTSTANALMYFERAAQQNNPPAHYKLALYYFEGTQVTKDETKAMFHLTKSMEGQFLPAIYKMGEVCEATDLQKALNYYIASANKGYADALYKMGKLEDMRLIERKEPYQISLYYLKAADKGHAEAQYQVGLCYETGTRTKKDTKKAISFYKMAAAKGHSMALIKLQTLDESSLLKRTQKIIDSQPKNRPSFPTGFFFFPNNTPMRIGNSVKPSDIMIDDALFLPLGIYPRPEECPPNLMDKLHEIHRVIHYEEAPKSQPKRQRIQTFLI